MKSRLCVLLAFFRADRVTVLITPLNLGDLHDGDIYYNCQNSFRFSFLIFRIPVVVVHDAIMKMVSLYKKQQGLTTA